MKQKFNTGNQQRDTVISVTNKVNPVMTPSLLPGESFPVAGLKGETDVESDALSGLWIRN